MGDPIDPQLNILSPEFYRNSDIFPNTRCSSDSFLKVREEFTGGQMK
jgi:hypothetical protein